jgi:hypothetical protein
MVPTSAWFVETFPAAVVLLRWVKGQEQQPGVRLGAG